MHFHLPKPVHGWPALFGEVGIIVIGVLIALAAEQMVEALHWHYKVAEARQELRYEIGHNLQLMDWREMMAPCADRRLDQLDMIVTAAAATGRLPPLGKIGSIDGGTFPTAVWDSQISAETATHFSAIELGSIGRIYRFLELSRDMSRDDIEAWRTLNEIVGPGRPVDAVTLDQLVRALIVARQINHYGRRYKTSINKIMTQSGLGADFAQIDPRNPPVGRPHNPPICQPIGAVVPSAYGMTVN